MSNAVVLIAEDDVLELDKMERALELLDVQIHVARDGLQVLRQVRYRVPDLILLDVELPGLGESLLVRQLKGHPGTEAIPIIGVTAKHATADAATIGNCRGSITKPFDRDAFVALVQQHLPQQRVGF